jgi:hypothetical protein
MFRQLNGSSVAEAPDADSFGSDTARELPTSKKISPDFLGEISAEDFFKGNERDQARGTFHTVDVVSWEHEDTDWILETPESPQRLNPAKKPTVSASLLRVRNIAAARGWLSPNSSRALAKLSGQKIRLDQSETNALNFLLTRCAKIPDLKDDVQVLLTALNR